MKKFLFTVTIFLFAGHLQASACIQTEEQKNERFAKVDINSDGTVSQDEFLPNTYGNSIEVKTENWLAADTDKDGKLSKDEYLSATMPRCR